jgi:hypothetical protein
MTTRPTKEQINAALDRAANTARAQATHGDRILKHPLAAHRCEARGERWWMIGWIRILGESVEWEVWCGPMTNEGRLGTKR